MIYLLSGKILKNGQVVRIYLNVRKNLFSIQDKKSRRLIAYADSLLLTNVEMKIGKAGQLELEKNGKKIFMLLFWAPLLKMTIKQ